MQSSTPTSNVLGTLIVIVLKAKHLPNKVRIGKQNPYATVTYGLTKKRTKAIERGGQAPYWDSEFRFEIPRNPEDLMTPDGAFVDGSGGVMPLNTSEAAKSATRDGGRNVIRLACYADHPKDPVLIGEAILDLDDIIKKGTKDDWVPLENKSRYAGEVYVEMTWYSNEPKPIKPKKSYSVSGLNAKYGGRGSRDDLAGILADTVNSSPVSSQSKKQSLPRTRGLPLPPTAPLSQSRSMSFEPSGYSENSLPRSYSTASIANMSAPAHNQRPPLPSVPHSASYGAPGPYMAEQAVRYMADHSSPYMTEHSAPYMSEPHTGDPQAYYNATAGYPPTYNYNTHMPPYDPYSQAPPVPPIPPDMLTQGVHTSCTRPLPTPPGHPQQQPALFDPPYHPTYATGYAHPHQMGMTASESYPHIVYN